MGANGCLVRGREASGAARSASAGARSQDLRRTAGSGAAASLGRTARGAQASAAPEGAGKAIDRASGDGRTGPTFLLVGAAKSGTTALFRWLQQHPDVFMPRLKQPHYFAGLTPTFRGPGDQALNRDLVTDEATYRRLFAPGTGHRARGEASPFYLFYAERAAPRIRAFFPEMRLVVLLRDPVERAYSGYLHLVRDGREVGSFRHALDREEERRRQGWEPLWAHRGLGLYARQLGAFLAEFPRSQVGVWRYEELRAEPQRVYREVCEFIGVDGGFVPEFTRHNTGGLPRHPGLHALLVRLRAPHIAKRLLPERLAQWLVGRYLQHRPPPAHIARELRAYFRDDLRALQALWPEKDFTPWLG